MSYLMAGGRSENPWGQLVTWSAQSAPSLVGIGLTDLSKTGGPPWTQKAPTALQANRGSLKKIIITQKKGAPPVVCRVVEFHNNLCKRANFLYQPP